MYACLSVCLSLDFRDSCSIDFTLGRYVAEDQRKYSVDGEFVWMRASPESYKQAWVLPDQLEVALGPGDVCGELVRSAATTGPVAFRPGTAGVLQLIHLVTTNMAGQ